jgi:hypothetical protein
MGIAAVRVGGGPSKRLVVVNDELEHFRRLHKIFLEAKVLTILKIDALGVESYTSGNSCRSDGIRAC